MSRLFDGFDKVSSKAWKQKIHFDLKGADYNDTLIWKSPEGIDVKPFYHADDYSKTQVVSKENTSWQICQSIYVNNTSETNTKALKAIEQGAESISFIISNESIDLSELLQNIDTNNISVHIESQYLSSSLIDQYKACSNRSGIKLHTDIIGNLAKTGNWFHNLKKDHELLEAVVNNSEGFDTVLSVDMSLYQNAGANMIQQLAYGLAHANEYLNHFQNKIKQPFVFKVAVGTNYFFEIAKLRALRSLWQALTKEYNLNIPCHIIASPSKRNKTIYDYNTNMLRTTTECMSAILGEADSVCNLPYDAIYHKDNEFGERIARNQLLILKRESYFNAVENPSDGTYYIEEITHEMATKALKVLKDIEANGGFLNQLKEGTIQRKIKESAQKEQSRFNEGEDILLGTNKHPNPKDAMKHDLELYPFVKMNKRKTLIEPIIEKRLAETVEQERLKTE